MSDKYTDGVERDTCSWYDANAETFCAQTGELPMAHVYDSFLPLVARGGRILDAGCGSGRDSEYFLRAGYAVEAFDVSPRMAESASARTGLDVRVLSFARMDWVEAFDGIFANATLLHVPPADLPCAFERIEAALKPGGVLFASFKHGSGGYARDGVLRVWRHDEASVEGVLRACLRMEPLRMWTSPDTRPERAGDVWLHVLARKGKE